jgi:outer membrane protein assembly factor BamB
MPASRALVMALACTLLAGCASSGGWLPTIPAPRRDLLFGKSRKPAPLPSVNATRSASFDWQASVGKAAPGIEPAITADAVYAAASDGTLVRLDPATGAATWRASAARSLAAGPGADERRVVVGTDKGEVLAFDTAGKAVWTAHVSSEIVSPPRPAGEIVVVFVADGRVYGLASGDGHTVWVNQRSIPPLTVRNYAGGVMSRGGVFFGTPGGRLVALDAQTGSVGYDVAVATPKGATELERIADVTSLPYVDEQLACAVAYQGRVACFDVARGTLVWTRDISSLAGLTGDERNIYVTDDAGSVHALDRANGASVWKQDALKGRRIGGPQLLGADLLAVVDVEGWLHLLSRKDGSYVGRLASDGTAPTGQPVRRGESVVWQSAGGNVYSAHAR